MLAILAESAFRSLVLGSAVWVGLHLLRVRNPHVHMTSWAVVLVASLTMPLLMHWTTVTVPLPPSAVPMPANLWPAVVALPEPLPAGLPLEPGIAGTASSEAHLLVNWWELVVLDNRSDEPLIALTSSGIRMPILFERKFGVSPPLACAIHESRGDLLASSTLGRPNMFSMFLEHSRMPWTL